MSTRICAVCRQLLLVVLLVVILTACTLPTIRLPGQAAPAGGPGQDPTAVSSAGATGEEKGEPGAEPSDSDPDPTITTVLTAEDFSSSDNDALHDLILFTSLAGDPFPNLDAGARPDSQPERHLWAISPDGSRAGRLSQDGVPSALLPRHRPGAKTLILQNGGAYNHEAVETVSLPADCDPLTGAACSDFQFSPDGLTLAYLSGPEACGKTLTLVNILEGNPVQSWSNVHWYAFFQNGSVVLSIGDCDRQHIYLYYPNKDRQVGIGKEGILYQNGAAMLYQIPGKAPFQSLLWGFNLETSRVFLWAEEEEIIDDTPVWLGDGRHFVYQHRSINLDKEAGGAILEGPRQIILMDAWTRAQRLLAYDGIYDYHLCETAGEPCEQPYGDWLEVRRTPFRSIGFEVSEAEINPEVRCGLFGLECSQPSERFAINWKTGQMLPWDEVLPAREPAPAFSPPALDQDPLYADPEGLFALYTSTDGHNLWYVPRDGEPSLWVVEGENFVYLP